MIYTRNVFILAICLFEQLKGVRVSSTDHSTAIPDVADETSSKQLLSQRRDFIPNLRRRGDTDSQLFQKAKLKKFWNQILHKDKFTTHKHRITTHKQKHKFTTSKHKFTTNKHKYTTEKANNPRTRTPSSIINNGTQRFSKLGRTNDSWTRIHSGVASIHRRRRRWDYDENYDWENGGKDYIVPGDQIKKETKLEKFAKSWQKHALKVIFLFSFVSMLFCCCLAICKKFCSKVCETVCWHLKDYRDMCLNRDPTYRKARKFADDYGIELDYDQYTKIKKNYEEGFARGGRDEYKDLSGK